MARYVIMDYDKAMAAIVSQQNTVDEMSAIQAVPKEQHLPNRVAVVRTSSIQEFFVLASELLDETPTLVVREGEIVNDKTPPATPQGLSAHNAADEQRGTSMTVLEWFPGAADQDLMGFVVYRDGVQIGLAGTLSFVDPGVAPGEHVYDVHAIDTAQNKSQPATVTITTPDLDFGRDPLA
jgi:hypothetical protein